MKVKESIHKSLRKRRGRESGADWPVQTLALGLLVNLIVAV